MLMMDFVAVSDVHIKEEGDKAAVLFHQFLKHPLTQSSQIIFLLGDIFDLLVGSHKEYIEKFPQTFEALRELLESGKTIYQFEGNHDFHFENLISRLKEDWKIGNDSWIYQTEPKEFQFEGKRFLFAHGDEIEIENPTYQRYRNIIRSRFIKLLANKVVPFSIVNGIGVNASKKSRERNKKRYEDTAVNPVVQDKFRRIFKIEKDKRGLDYLICGHSHCQDLFKDVDQTFYSNNGYFPQTQIFTSFRSGVLEQIKL